MKPDRTKRAMTKNLDPETGFLEQLGQRFVPPPCVPCAACRERLLAKGYGISETLYRSVESGKGNVSIGLLRRGVECNGRDLEDYSRNRAFAGLPAHSRSRRRRSRTDAQAKDAPRRSRKRSSTAAGCRSPDRADRPARRGKSSSAKCWRNESAGFVEVLNKEIERQNGPIPFRRASSALYGQRF